MAPEDKEDWKDAAGWIIFFASVSLLATGIAFTIIKILEAIGHAAK